MVSATFIFKKKPYDEEFHRLDAAINEAARKNPEFLGVDSWENPDQGLSCVVYYYKTLAGVADLRQVAAHREAKAQYSRWYDGYQVIVAEIHSSYGDGTIPHPTPSLDY